MKITWKIHKKRGFFRPTLAYKVEFEEWEKSLGIPTVTIESTIPQPSDYYVNKDTLENDESETMISLGSAGGTPTLPYRQPGQYPEVKESMEQLRAAIEAAIIQAHDSLALNIKESLDMTPATKKHVAAYVARWKMTQQQGE